MNAGPQLLLLSGVVAVGILHTIVPDHWLPIALLARQQGWSRAETAWASARAGFGHVASTLLIGVAVWLGGAALAERYGAMVDVASSLALIAFGGWIALSAWQALRRDGAHAHPHGGHHHHHDEAAHRHEAPHRFEPGWATADAVALVQHSHIHRHGVENRTSTGTLMPRPRCMAVWPAWSTSRRCTSTITRTAAAPRSC